MYLPMGSEKKNHLVFHLNKMYFVLNINTLNFVSFVRKRTPIFHTVFILNVINYIVKVFS